MRLPCAVLVLVAASLSLGSTGCIKEMLLNGQIEATRKGSAAVDTLGDYEVAYTAAFNGLVQFEGMHYLAPDNEDALFMLTKGWVGAGFAFIEDQMEQAEDSEGTESALYLYHQARAKSAYERAAHYGIDLLERHASGFEKAKKNDSTMKAWLANFTDKERDSANLFWVANAWMSKVNVAKDDPAMVAELFIGVAMMERSVELDDTYMKGSGRAILGAYHARSPMAELDDAKKELDKAAKISEGKSLLVKLQLASRYYCTKGDKDNYVKTLNEIVEAGDLAAELRLTNTIAKRRARRYLSKSRMRACGF